VLTQIVELVRAEGAAERLRSRSANEYDRIARLKAHVFEGQARLAETRAAWGREGLELLREDADGTEATRAGE
jgi:hypothetical protein